MTVVLDPRTRVLDGGRTLVGGDPWRVLRLTEGGAAVVRGLLAGAGTGPGAGGGDTAARALARQLIDAGLAHPRATPVPCGEVTVVIPVHDRTEQLERCLASVFEADRPGRVIVVDDGSRDAAGVDAVCARMGAELIRRDRCSGPAAARNTALARVESGLVALLDSDCVPEQGWLSLLCGTLAVDPGLGAVAPRVRPLEERWEGLSPSGRQTFPASRGNRALARFAAVRSPLDLGPWPSLVRPGGRVAYVPTAAVLVRREALGEAATPFDPALRYGEDVDLVWRMLDGGWSIRYQPEAVVRHGEPGRLRPWLARRFRYGSSAGPLARRHPKRLAPVVIHPPSATVLGAAAAAVGSRRVPSAAAALPVALHAVRVARSLSYHGVSARTGAALGLQGLGESGAALGRATTMLAPPLVAAGLLHARTRRPALALLLAAPVRDCARLRPSLDPVRFATLSIADDVSYGAGVWAGALRARTVRPLRPRINRRVSPGRGLSTLR